MNLLASAPGWLATIFFLLLLAAASQDGLRLQISDWISGGIAVAAFGALALSGPIVGLWQNFVIFAAVLAVGTFMFGRGWMGGGDIKLLAASVLWFDLSNGWRLLVAIALAGGLEALIIIGLRRLRWPDSVRARVLLLQRRGGIPYGIAIALGVALMGWWLRN
jgi:prepilin peptidase CpaA